MAIPPSGPTPSYPGASIWGPHPKSKASSNARTDDPVQAAADASQQITRSQQQVQQAQQDADVGLENIRDSYSKESLNESSKNEDAVEKQRLKGYEALRDLKRAQETEINRVRREGERDLKASTDYYRDTLYKTAQTNEQNLRELQAQKNRESEFVKTTGQSQVELDKGEQSRKLEDLKRTQDQQLTELTEAAHTQFEQMKTNTITSKGREDERFQSEYKSVLKNDQDSIGRLTHEANTQIRQIRQDTAQKLAAYDSRQTDPFYKMIDLNAQVQDEGDRFVLTATIPTHEQEHLSVALRGNAIILSGNRRNEEKLDIAPGRFKGTSSFQSFQESFPLTFPVDKNKLTKEFHGDTVVITVPKSNIIGYQAQPEKGPQPERYRAERPQFPGNLPVAENSAEKTEPDGKTPGSRTLG